jgi:predicted PurR-regulated permease PerM
MKDNFVFFTAIFFVLVFSFVAYQHEEVVVRNKNIQEYNERIQKTLKSLSAEGASLLSIREQKDSIASLSASSVLFAQEGLLETLRTLEAQ